MTPTRDRIKGTPSLDTGTGSPVTERPDAWAYAGPPSPAGDSGIGSPPARRPDTLDAGDAFIPAWWP